MTKSFNHIPADVPSALHATYTTNYQAIAPTGKLFLFACDQKIEHLNDDFYGAGIAPQANNPEHLFTIASKGKSSAFATHLGLIAQYGNRFPHINYLVKLNGKTNTIPTTQKDPLSLALWTMDDVLTFAQHSKLPIRGIGYTIYIGSEYEAQMLHQAAQYIFQAHQHGLVSVLWVYPRGKALSSERDGALIAGAAGLAASLGADFAKINVPEPKEDAARWLTVAAQAAGNTKLICSGGAVTKPQLFLETISQQLQAGMHGCAVGRNIFTHDTPYAIAFTQAIAAVIAGQTGTQASALLPKGA